MSKLGTRVHAGLAALVQRVIRLRPDRIPPAYLPWTIGTWVATLALCGLILSPAFGTVLDAGSTSIEAFVSLMVQPWFRVLLVSAFAVLAGAAVTAATLHARRSRPVRSGVRLIIEVVYAAGSIPVLLLAGDRVWVLAIAALAALALLEIVAHSARVHPSLVGLAGALPWLAFLAEQVLGDGVVADEFSWVAVIVFGTAYIWVLAAYGFTRAADSRVRAFRFLYRDDLPRWAVLLIVGIMVALVTLRILVGQHIFDDFDASLWAPFGKKPHSWVLAGLLAAFIVALALRSSRRPFRRLGEKGTAAVFAILSARVILLLALAFVGILVLEALGADPEGDLGRLLTDSVFLIEPFLVIPALVVASLVVVAPRFRGSAGRWYTLLAVAYLLPFTVLHVLDSLGIRLPAEIDGFAVTPVQISLFLLVVAVAFAVANLALPPQRRINPSAIVRLAVVPFVAFHVGRLLPALWSGAGRWVVVAGVLVALLILMPKAAADRERHAFSVLRTSALQLLALGGFVIGASGFGSDSTPTTVLWLSVIVFAALTVDTRDAGDIAAPSATSGIPTTGAGPGEPAEPRGQTDARGPTEARPADSARTGTSRR